MDKKKKNYKKKSFRPPMDEASNPIHEPHVKKIREEENI
jgi:hypothetical protein